MNNSNLINDADSIITYLQNIADELFGLIDKELAPTVRLISVPLQKDALGKYNISVEPNTEDYLQIEGKINCIDLFHSLQQSLYQILTVVNNDTYKQISEGVLLTTHTVFLLIELNETCFNRYNKLDSIQTEQILQKSFIESVLHLYLDGAIKLLDDIIHENTKVATIEPSELMRRAGQKLMVTVGWKSNRNVSAVKGLYNVCNAISSLKYEGEDGIGKMIVARIGHPNVHLTFMLHTPIELSNFRKIRKFLELSDENAWIVSDAQYIYGLGELVGEYNPKDTSLFVVHFISHYRWELLHDRKCLMRVQYNEPNVPKNKLDKDKFLDTLTEIFGNMSETYDDPYYKIWDVALKCTEQKHGTMIVISDHAEEEAERLGNQSFRVKKFSLDMEIVLKISSIDGAILVDDKCVCYGIGVILDGVAVKEQGDSGRGARYNSATRYYEMVKNKHKTLILIVSEDGMIDTIPKIN